MELASCEGRKMKTEKELGESWTRKLLSGKEAMQCRKHWKRRETTDRRRLALESEAGEVVLELFAQTSWKVRPVNKKRLWSKAKYVEPDVKMLPDVAVRSL